MKQFPENVSILFPMMLEPCLPDEVGNVNTPVMTLDEPDNLNACALLAPLAGHFYHCGVSRHEAGYDCDVVLLPLAPLLTHLTVAAKTTPTPLTDRLLKTCRHWGTQNTDLLRLTLPNRQQNFGIEQHIWGHESASHPPILRHRARTLTGDICDFCGYTCKDNPLIFRDSNPENQADANLGLACTVCACSRHLNRLGANDGVMVYLPELAPADISHLIRATLVAKQQGDERQKQGATTLLRWLTEHRKEVDAFWGTSHPGEFGQALMQATDRQREDLQQRLRHIALIPNPDLISGHLSTTTNATTAWSSLFNQYRSQH